MSAVANVSLRHSGIKRTFADSDPDIKIARQHLDNTKRQRTCVDSNYLYLANTISSQLMSMSEKIERQLSKLNNRLDNLESQFRKLNDELQTQQHYVSMNNTIISTATHDTSIAKMDITLGTDVSMLYA